MSELKFGECSCYEGGICNPCYDSKCDLVKTQAEKIERLREVNKTMAKRAIRYAQNKLKGGE